MSLDYPEYEEIRKKSWFLGLLWRIGDVGYYIGLFGTLMTPLFAITMKTPRITWQTNIYAAFICTVSWLAIHLLSRQIKNLALKRGRKLLNRNKY